MAKWATHMMIEKICSVFNVQSQGAEMASTKVYTSVLEANNGAFCSLLNGLPTRNNPVGTQWFDSIGN